MFANKARVLVYQQPRNQKTSPGSMSHRSTKKSVKECFPPHLFSNEDNLNIPKTAAVAQPVFPEDTFFLSLDWQHSPSRIFGSV
ncbi:hypothetical protein NPIL_515031 [Nephila pilipes]|uniref:Uncharacterized protein n=1 Tax=Nephila pilipes TaxID=299642 RepID=A0A8X6P8B7_NEPPI|nr:hypothetical protein NPIL_515031 [Nephila pilipes]